MTDYDKMMKALELVIETQRRHAVQILELQAAVKNDQMKEGNDDIPTG
jgi:hypothetical protein